MPIHDWTRVAAGIYHGFHVTWLGQISGALNRGPLPAGYYALPEQDVAGYRADVLTLRTGPRPTPTPGGGGGPAVAEMVATYTDEAVRKRARQPYRWIAVKKSNTDETVAVIELVSAANKNNRDGFRAFVRKSADLIDRGVHLLLVDLLPPGRRDPHGMHAAVWGELTGRRFAPPADGPLTLASYEAADPLRAFIEPTAAGRVLPDMPLFLAPGLHVAVPLDAAYRAAWELFPDRWRDVLAPPAS